MTHIDYTGITSRQHNAINDVMDAFEFDKVYAHMKHVNWGWASKTSDGNDYLEVPDMDHIKHALRKMLVHVYTTMNDRKTDSDVNGPCYSSSGGFTVYVWPDDSCQAYFSVTDWWVDSDVLDENN